MIRDDHAPARTRQSRTSRTCRRANTPPAHSCRSRHDLPRSATRLAPGIGAEPGVVPTWWVGTRQGRISRTHRSEPGRVRATKCTRSPGR
ncbi:hypothetical protein D9V37_14500 [Nocardioides mangrovicus]|uniref:Uncharacterized protein n=1 Tax=Nocardioides mangrovicus TaxID=2478913 RepID=A0A3L8P0M6_9ACTN|nr:hypothetical protein D9V37_14500 [Nocardioides mangrovicus]